MRPTVSISSSLLNHVNVKFSGNLTPLFNTWFYHIAKLSFRCAQWEFLQKCLLSGFLPRKFLVDVPSVFNSQDKDIIHNFCKHKLYCEAVSLYHFIHHQSWIYFQNYLEWMNLLDSEFRSLLKQNVTDIALSNYHSQQEHYNSRFNWLISNHANKHFHDISTEPFVNSIKSFSPNMEAFISPTLIQPTNSNTLSNRKSNVLNHQSLVPNNCQFNISCHSSKNSMMCNNTSPTISVKHVVASSSSVLQTRVNRPITSSTFPEERNNSQPALSSQNLSTNTCKNSSDPNISNWVVNLSNKQLNSLELEVLSFGCKFAVDLGDIPIFDLYVQIENIVKEEHDPYMKNILRSKLVNTIRTKNIPNQTHKQIATTMINLKRDKTIVILNADKGDTTVIMNRDDYNQKLLSYLQNEHLFKSSDTNPTQQITRTWTNLLSSFKQTNNMDKFLLRSLKPIHYDTSPTIFATVKIHKQDNPLRPILNCKHHPLYMASKLIATELNKFKPLCPNRIDNPSQFLTTLKNTQLGNNSKICTLDIVDMYNSIPHSLIFNMLNWIYTLNNNLCNINLKDMTDMVKILITSNFCKYNGTFFTQQKGLPMGSPLSPVLADLTIAYLEAKFYIPLSNNVSLWQRYVDDICIVWNSTTRTLRTWLSKLNNINKDIQFKLDINDGTNINFLDINIELHNNSPSTSVYRKPSFSGRCINFNSNHPKKVFMAVAIAYYLRAIRYSSNTTILNKELNFIKTLLINNKYPKSLINRAYHKAQHIHTTRKDDNTDNTKKWHKLHYLSRVHNKIHRHIKHLNINLAIKPTDTLGSIYHKPKLNPNTNGCIYAIKCKCNQWYIGETGRHVTQRIKEHKNFTKQKHKSDPYLHYKSAIAKHHHTCTQEIDWQNPILLDTENNTTIRKLKEALYIKICKPKMNISNGVEIPPQWYHVLHKNINRKHIKLLTS